MKATLVIGASPKPHRYAYRAIEMLREAGHPVYAYGLREGFVGDVPITHRQAEIPAAEVDTVTLYVGPRNQEGLETWLQALAPRRVIFNPGTENPALMRQLRHSGIEPVQACTLVMLAAKQY